VLPLVGNSLAYKPVRLATSQHAAHNVCCADSFCPLHHAKSAYHFGVVVCIATIWKKARVVTVNNVVNLMMSKEMVDEVLGQNVRGLGYDFINPFYSLNESTAFFVIHHWRAFVFDNIFVRVDTHNKNIPQRFGLTQGICVAIVHQVEAPVKINPHRTLAAPPFAVRL
jgi:hypothetical protein